MSDKQLKIGSVVLSKKGRDKGGYFAVTQIAGDTLFVSDGVVHKLSKPKKKNVKHVADSGIVLSSISEKLAANKKVFDSELKSALRQFNESNK